MNLFKCILTIWSITLFSTPPLQADTKPRSILAIGDSLTFGYGVADKDSWPSLLENKLKAKGFSNLSVINAGVSGATTASGLRTLKFHLKKTKPSLMIYALGANDGLRGLDVKSTESNIGSVLDLAKEKKIKVLLLGMKAPPNYGKTFTSSFEQVFTKLAKEYKVAFLPFFLDGVAGRKELNQPDGIHPNAKGYEIISESIIKKVENLL